MLKPDLRRSLPGITAAILAIILVALTGGARSSWIAALAPACFLLGWSGGLWIGLASSIAVFLALLAIVGYAAPHLPPVVLRSHLFSFGLIGLACPLGLVRWVRPMLGTHGMVDQLRWHRKLADLSRTFGYHKDPETAFDQVLLGMQQIAAAPATALLLYDISSGLLEAAASEGMDASFQDAVLPVGGSGIGSALLSGAAVSCADTARSGIEPPFPGCGAPGSYALLPLLSAHGLVGACYWSWPEPRPLDGPLLKRLADFATPVAASLDRLRTVREFEESALADRLTGLYNGRMLDRRLAEETARAARQKESVGLLLFKLEIRAANPVTPPPPSKGSAAAPDNLEAEVVPAAALQAAAETLRHEGRASDVPARYDGSLLALLCPGLTLARAAPAADRIRSAMEEAVQKAAAGLHVAAAVGSYPETTSDRALLLPHTRAALSNPPPADPPLADGSAITSVDSGTVVLREA